MILRRNVLSVLVLVLASGGATARSPAREAIEFSRVTNTGVGRAVFVVGNHPDVGNWTPTGAVKLFWTPGDVWTGRVAVQAGTALEYKFITRSLSSNLFCDSGNVEWMGGANLSTNLPAQPAAPYAGKTVCYFSAWTNASLIYRLGTNWYGTNLAQVGEGRTPGEYLYRAAGFGEAGEDIEFIPTGWLNNTQYWDHAPYDDFGGNYVTPLDVFVLQDGNLFNYRPPAVVPAGRIETHFIVSTVAGISSRTVRVYLPRGYATNTWKSYPTLYMQDGQNVFAPGGAYGCWGAESCADREIGQGRMRETVIVAMDNTGSRGVEYMPPGDTFPGLESGRANDYLRFVVLDVKGFIDSHYRTLTNRANSFAAGSSMGGLVTCYLGWETHVFGGVALMSPSFTRAPNYTNHLFTQTKQDLRIYMDTGTEETVPGVSYWDTPWDIYSLFLRHGYAVNSDLIMRIGCGHHHDEWAWSNRLHNAFRFLLDPRLEPNWLAQAEYPPAAQLSGSGIEVRVEGLSGYAYELEKTPSLVIPQWDGAATSGILSRPWASTTLVDSAAAAVTSRYYRVKAVPSP